MVAIHNLGFSRMGAQRQLKFALEGYWQGKTDLAEVLSMAHHIRQLHWQYQLALDWIPVGDFSLYDHVLDMSMLLGHIPERFQHEGLKEWDLYFAMARGRATSHAYGYLSPMEMTKWFDTNYHYLVPELSQKTRFSLHSDRLLQVTQEAHASNIPAKVVLLGPMTYLWLSKSKDHSHPLDFMQDLLGVYTLVLAQLHAIGVQWVQLDEPIIVGEVDTVWQEAFVQTYRCLVEVHPQILFTTYFGDIVHQMEWVADLPVAGLHIDAVRGASTMMCIHEQWPQHKILSIGIVDGRNIWKTDLCQALDQLEPISQNRGEHLWLAPSCSLLHIPIDLRLESEIPSEIRSWMAFGLQRIDELQVLKRALIDGRSAVQDVLMSCRQSLKTRSSSSYVMRSRVQQSLKQFHHYNVLRTPSFQERRLIQQESLRLPLFPTTTIGSFPQTSEIRQTRREWKKGLMEDEQYQAIMRAEIEQTIREQESLGLDVLVHGEAERCDMVEYFGRYMQGFVFTQSGWVQSYGSRCVKPPIIVGDIERMRPITVDWIYFAQSCTEKPVKGILTGPVTILNWSFVRNDQPRELTGQQLALALRSEVMDLERAGIPVIQIDEAALREGLPLKESERAAYLDWAISCFRVCTSGVEATTQIHTHMCYSDFHTIFPSVMAMDADVLLIENARSDGELLQILEENAFTQQLGPGVYDIHTPHIPSRLHMESILRKVLQYLPAERLWVNPDCGLKTRRWTEVRSALGAMVQAAKNLRAEYE